MGNLVKGIVVLFLFLFVTFYLSAQAPDIAWTKTFGGSGSDYGESVQQTTDGGYIVAGTTYSYGTGSGDIYLIKTDSLGDTLWTRTYGGANAEYGESVQQTTDGGYIITGSTSSYGAGSDDIYLIKTDSLGDTLWTRTYGGANIEYGWSVQQTTDGGYIVAGRTQSYGAGSMDVYLIKTDSLGDTLWTRTYGGANDEYGLSVQQTTDGGYIITGPTHSYGAGSIDVYLIKTDSLGDTLWTRTYGGAKVDHGNSVQQTTDGGYIVAGSTSSYGAGWWDIYLIKTNSIGTTLWTRIFGGSDDDWGSSVKQTIDGGYIVAGNTYSSGLADIYLIKTDHLGGSLWIRTYGGSHSERCYSVQQTTDGGYIISGATDSSWATRMDDVYLVKIKPLPEIAVTSPNGGENWLVDSTYNITWVSYQTSGGVKIEYSLNNGIDWMEIIASTPDDGSHPWTIPDTTSDSCLVRVSDTNGLLEDVSNSVFRISPPFITVISPNGGEEWEEGGNYYITWTSAGTSGEVKIEYSINNGSDWITIADSILDEEIYSWIIPDTKSDSCLVSVIDVDGNPSDTSDAVFRIISFITVISPNGGEVWYNEDNHYINWISAGTSGEVKIEYSINNGLDWSEIIASTPDDGSYLWNPPYTVSDSCLVSISDTNGTLSDMSDSVFSIIPGSGITVDGLPDTYSLNVKSIAAGSQIEFTYTLPEKANDIRFTLYNIAGLKIKEENLKESPAGFYSGKINLSGVSKGIYFIRMEANGGELTQTKKFLLM